jgi:Sec-independent protein translocase protein TatA
MIVAALTPPVIGIILLVLILFFYRKRIPAMGKSLGQSLRRGKKQFDAHQERQDRVAELEATVVSEEDMTQARAKRERDEI